MTYSDVLARIHEAGFTQVAQAAAPHVTGKRVLDLGCGGGTMASLLADRTYTGIDISPEMIRLAREKAPHTTFMQGSIYDMDLPPADSVLAIGEVFNYEFAPRRFSQLLRNIHASLESGGQLLFDIATPGRTGGGSMQVGDWNVTAWTEARGAHLTRFIEVRGAVHFDEQHTLKLMCPEATREALVDAGFAVEILPGYDAPLGPGWCVFSCTAQR